MSTEREKRPGGKVTLKQVAEATGVHASTVSRALNPVTRTMVAEDVAIRVLRVAEELGYRPNLLAAGLRTGRSHLVGALVPNVGNTLFSMILSGTSERLADRGYSLVIADVGDQPTRQLELAEQLVSRRIDGLILATVSRDDPLAAFCVEQGLPAVLVNRAEERRRISAVVSDDVLGMHLAVDHLIELGHRHIAHIAGPEMTSTGHLRRQGFLHAIEEHGLAISDCPIYSTTGYSREEGALATERLLEADRQTTAIVAANDLLALGAYDCLKTRGVDCPRSMSVVGHNDMPLVDLITPPLTTIRISHQEIGRQAASLLLSRMEGKDMTQRNIVLTPTLVVRGSTAAARVDRHTI